MNVKGTSGYKGCKVVKNTDVCMYVCTYLWLLGADIYTVVADPSGKMHRNHNRNEI